jgi:hypothetical protein
MKAIYPVLLMISLLSQVAVAGQDKLYTSKGYPYKNLVSMAEQVRIVYVDEGLKAPSTVAADIDNGDEDSYVSCRVEVNWQDNERKSNQYRVKKSVFDEAPLASCLPRKLAKQFLSDIYAG